MSGFTVHAVLAGAYKGKRADLKATLNHASSDFGLTAVCGKVKEGSLCEDDLGLELTCPACIRETTKKK